MLVNTINFWVFFSCVFITHNVIFRHSSRLQNISLFCFSYIFYGMVDWNMSALLLGSTFIFYVLGHFIYKERENVKISRSLTILGICVGTGLLLYFKYLNFFCEQFEILLSICGLNTNWNSFVIIMPLGVSFFTFKLIGYIIEVYRGNIIPSKDFIIFGTYIAYFPTIMSGPIDNSVYFMPQLQKNRRVCYKNIVEGGKRVLWGLFLKMCVADQLSSYTSSVLDNYCGHNATSIILASLLYSFQLYTDFAGYSEMAIGVSLMLGIKVTENFYRPYFATSVSEFWRRWHMSLTKWLTNYVYISLGGNRCVKIRQYWNIMVTFFISGLWHGANWTFVLWGCLHGIYLIIEKYFGLNKKREGNSPGEEFHKIDFFRILITFLLVTINWVLFQSKSVKDFWGTMETLSNGFAVPYMNNKISIITASICIIIVMFKEYKDEKGWKIHLLHSDNKRICLISAIVLAYLIILFGNFGSSQFIYTQF